MSRELGKHKRSKSEGENRTYQHWDQFLATKQGEVIEPASFGAHDIQKPAYHTNNPKKQAINHPAYTHHVRELVTYKSTRSESKPSCKYGQYRDGSSVKCIRSHDHHAKENPDRRKQNGNQNTFRRRRRFIKVVAANAPKTNKQVQGLIKSGGPVVTGQRARTKTKK